MLFRKAISAIFTIAFVISMELSRNVQSENTQNLG